MLPIWAIGPDWWRLHDYCIGLTDVISRSAFLSGVCMGGVHRLSFVFQFSPSPMSQPSDLSTSQGLPLKKKKKKKKKKNKKKRKKKSANFNLTKQEIQVLLENYSTLVDFNHPSFTLMTCMGLYMRICLKHPSHFYNLHSPCLWTDFKDLPHLMAIGKTHHFLPHIW